MVYKRYIKRRVNGEWKTFGPYYYESYRDEKGNTHSRYLPDYNPKRAVTKNIHGNVVGKKKILLFVLIIAIVAIILAVGVLNYQFNSPQKVDSGQNPSVIKSVFGFLTGHTTEEGVDSSGSSEVSSDADSESGGEVSVPSESGEESATSDTPVTEETIESSEVPAEEVSNIVEESPSEEATFDSSIEVGENNETGESESNDTVIEPEINESLENETLVEENDMSIVSNETPDEGEGLGGGVILENETNETTQNLNETIIENESVQNETIVNVTGNMTLSETIQQYGAVLGEPVRWEKKVKVIVSGGDKISGINIDLVDLAGNISVKKKKGEIEEEVNIYVNNERGDKEVESSLERQRRTPFNVILNFFLGFFRGMTGRVTDLGQSEDVSVDVVDEISNNDELVIEYYTPAPYSVEQEIEGGKEVKIIGPEEIHYENVLAFTNLDEELQIKSKSNIWIYWEEEKRYISYEEVYDTDSNGIYDYVEWVVPHLSNQTFRIIVVTVAEHLDENRTFISDIYDEVKELDDNWTETINDSHYVRIVFERNLTSANDITIYPRFVEGIPYVEIYEVNGTESIANFSYIVENELNKVYLVGLNTSQDTFDLLVKNGSIEFDYIIDPIGVCSGGVCLFDYNYALEDIYATEGGKTGDGNGVQIMWNVTDLCDGTLESVDSAQIQFYIVAVSGSPDNDGTQRFVADETWSEADDAPAINGQSTTNATTATMSSTTASTYTNITVTTQVAQACNLGYDNLTIRFEDNDYLLNAGIGSVSDSTTTLLFGQDKGITPNQFIFAPREHATSSYRPKLYVTYTASGGNTAPKWSDNSTNTTGAGELTKYNLYWTDDTNLSGYKFSYDNGTGSYTNDSWVGMIGTGNWSNVTKVANYTQGSTIKWRIYANDSDGDWNVTSEFSYVTNNTPTHSNPLITPYPNGTSSQNINCSNSSTFDPNGDVVTNIYNWKRNGGSVVLLNLPFDTNFPNAGSDVIKDYSGYGNHGSTDAASHPIWNSSGVVGGSISFNGSQYFNVTKDASMQNLSGFTIEFWFRPNSTDSSGLIMDNVDGVDYTGHLRLLQSPTGVKLYLGTVISTVAGQGVPEEWTHIVFVADGGNNLSGYKNGILNNSVSLSLTNLLDLGDNDFVFGRQYDGANYLNASIDGFRMWNFAMGSDQIQQLYNESKDGYSNSSTILASSTRPNQNWTCEVTPNDAENDGTKKINYTFIYNNIPTHDNPSISPYDVAYVDEDLICENSTTADSDGDSVSNVYNWLIDGVSLTTLYWAFNNNVSGTGEIVKDYSGNFNNGTIDESSGPVDFTTGCLNGGCYDFDGSGGMISVSNETLNFTDNFTINYWVKDNLGAVELFKMGNSTDGFSQIFDGSQAIYVIEGEQLKHSEASTSGWQMYTLNCKVGNCSAYVNGTYENSTATTPTEHTLFNFTLGVGISNDYGGKVDEFRIYNRSLSSAQIMQLYQEGINSFTNSSIVYEETGIGENWTCEVTPADSYDDGLTKINYTLVIDPAPSQDEPIFFPNPAYVSYSLTCINQSTSDPGGRNVSNVYNWKLNSTSILLINMPFNLNSSSVGKDDIYDYSENLNNGTLGGGDSSFAPSWVSDGIFGGAYNFSQDDNISIDNSYSLNQTFNFSVDFWVRPRSVSGTQYIFSNAADATSSGAGIVKIYLYNDDARINLEGTTITTYGTSFGVGGWTHVAITVYNTTTTNIYINGTLKTSQSITSVAGPYFNNGTDFVLGSDLGGGGHLNGTLDNFRIWNKTLSTLTVEKIYQEEAYKYQNSSLNLVDLKEGDNWTCQVTPTSDLYVGATKENWTYVNGCVQVGGFTELSENSYACYVFNESNGTLDCNNYEITIESDKDASINGDAVGKTVSAINKTNVTLQNCRIKDVQFGVYFDNTTYSHIKNVTFFNITDWSEGVVYTYPIWLYSNSNHTLIEDVNISVVNASSTSVSGCFNGEAVGIKINRSENVSVKNSFINNVFDSNQGVESEGCNPTGRVELSYGIDARSYSNNNTIYNLSVSDVGTAAANCVDSNYSNISMSNLSDFNYGARYLSCLFPYVFRNVFSYCSSYCLYPNSLSNDGTYKDNQFYYFSSEAISSGSVGGFMDNNSFFHGNVSGNVVDLSPLTVSCDNNTFYNITLQTVNEGAFYSAYSANCSGNNFTNVTIAYEFGSQAGMSSIENDILTNVNVSVFAIAGNVSFFNVTFNHSSTNISLAGQFYAYYYLTANVTDQNLDGIESATVDLRNSSGGSAEQSKSTNAVGLTDLFVVEILKVNATGAYNRTPHNITAYKSGFNSNSSEFNFLSSMQEHLILYTPKIIAFVPDTYLVSINEPDDQAFSITYANVTPVRIRWFVNDSEEVGSENSSSFLWEGNYTQAGAYAIKVNISNDIGEDENEWLLEVNNTGSTLWLNTTYPEGGEINISQNTFGNLTFNLTCRGPDCGTINMSLYYVNRTEVSETLIYSDDFATRDADFWGNMTEDERTVVSWTGGIVRIQGVWGDQKSGGGFFMNSPYNLSNDSTYRIEWQTNYTRSNGYGDKAGRNGMWLLNSSKNWTTTGGDTYRDGNYSAPARGICMAQNVWEGVDSGTNLSNDGFAIIVDDDNSGWANYDNNTAENDSDIVPYNVWINHTAIINFSSGNITYWIVNGSNGAFISNLTGDLEVGHWGEISPEFVVAFHMGFDPESDVSYSETLEVDNFRIYDLTSSINEDPILVSTSTTTPYYTNSSENPYTTGEMNSTNSSTEIFWVNATGNVDDRYEFYATANLTSDPSIGNITDRFNVTIVEPEIFIAIALSPWLEQQVNWSISSLPAVNESALGNDGDFYYVNLSVTGGTADLYVKADANLSTPGGDTILLGNETYVNVTNGPSWPEGNDGRVQMTDGYQMIGSGLSDGDQVFLHFFLSVPPGSAAGNYNNSLDFKAVANGLSP